MPAPANTPVPVPAATSAAAAEAKKAALAAMQPWLVEMDAGDYAKSWRDASSSFRNAISSDKWVEMSDSVRTPIGKCLKRTLVSSVEEQNPGETLGDFVMAQFDSSFENMKYAIETVTFEKEIDGTWKAAGYHIRAPG